MPIENPLLFVILQLSFDGIVGGLTDWFKNILDLGADALGWVYYQFISNVFAVFLYNPLPKSFGGETLLANIKPPASDPIYGGLRDFYITARRIGIALLAFSLLVTWGSRWVPDNKFLQYSGSKVKKYWVFYIILIWIWWPIATAYMGIFDGIITMIAQCDPSVGLNAANSCAFLEQSKNGVTQAAGGIVSLIVIYVAGLTFLLPLAIFWIIRPIIIIALTVSMPIFIGLMGFEIGPFSDLQELGEDALKIFLKFVLLPLPAAITIRVLNGLGTSLFSSGTPIGGGLTQVIYYAGLPLLVGAVPLYLFRKNATSIATGAIGGQAMSQMKNAVSEETAGQTVAAGKTLRGEGIYSYSDGRLEEVDDIEDAGVGGRVGMQARQTTQSARQYTSRGANLATEAAIQTASNPRAVKQAATQGIKKSRPGRFARGVAGMNREKAKQSLKDGYRTVADPAKRRVAEMSARAAKSREASAYEAQKLLGHGGGKLYETEILNGQKQIVGDHDIDEFSNQELFNMEQVEQADGPDLLVPDSERDADFGPDVMGEFDTTDKDMGDMFAFHDQDWDAMVDEEDERADPEVKETLNDIADTLESGFEEDDEVEIIHGEHKGNIGTAKQIDEERGIATIETEVNGEEKDVEVRLNAAEKYEDTSFDSTTEDLFSFHDQDWESVESTDSGISDVSDISQSAAGTFEFDRGDTVEITDGEHEDKTGRVRSIDTTSSTAVIQLPDNSLVTIDWNDIDEYDGS